MIRDWVHGMGHSPLCQILLQIFMQGTYHGISSRLYQLPWDIVYLWRFSLLERFYSCFDLLPQDWVFVSVGNLWDSQHLRVTYDCVAVQFRTVFCPPV